MKLCECNCGQLAKNRFINGHNNRGKPSTFKGRHHTEEARMNISKALMGHKYPKERNEKISKTMKGKKKAPFTEIHKNHISEARKGIKFSRQHTRKLRLKTIERINKNFGICFPAYNKKACEFFKSYDNIHNTQGHYAMYGGGEYLIKELGYWLDYINFDKKIIIEWDEIKHYNEGGELKSKDKIRQQEIEQMYPDFKFIRIREV